MAGVVRSVAQYFTLGSVGCFREASWCRCPLKAGDELDSKDMERHASEMAGYSV